MNQHTAILPAPHPHPAIPLPRTPQLTARGLDRPALRIAVLLALIITLNLFDLAYTLFAHGQGVLNEMNPIAASLFFMDLERGVIYYKALTLLVGISLLWKVRASPWTRWACWLIVLVYASLAVRWLMWSNNYTQALELEPTLRLVYHAAKPL